MEEIKKEKRKKILVTGSGGMLGTELCRELSNNYEVTGLDLRRRVIPRLRSGQASHESRVTKFIHCDITDKDRTVKSILDTKPDLIIHAAAWTDVDECEKEPDRAKRINEEGTGNVAGSARELDIPLMYISTDFVFDGDKANPYTENNLPNPVNVYGKSKLEGEKKVTALNKYIILRTGWMYGKNGKNFVDMILKKAKTEKEIKIVDDQIGSPTYTRDFAKAITRLLHESREIYHISNKGQVSWFDYAKEILGIAKIDDVKVLPIKSDQLERPARRPHFSVLDNTKFEKATGFVMRRWQEALREYLKTKNAKRKRQS